MFYQKISPYAYFVDTPYKQLLSLRTLIFIKVIQLVYMKIDVEDIEFKNAVTYPISE